MFLGRDRDLPRAAVLHRRPNEFPEERVWLERPALELGMILYTDEPRMILDFGGLHEFAVG